MPVKKKKKVTRWLNKDLNTRHEKLDNAVLQLEDNMKSNKELFLDKEYVKIKKETFESINEVINETKNVMEVQPKLESAFKKVDGFTSSYKSLQMTTKKLNKEVESLKDDNEKLQKENNSLKDIISNLLQRIKELFRKILLHGNDYSKDEAESNIIDLYLDDSFEQKDVYQISKGTSKEDNLFEIADIPDYYKEYNKSQKDNYYKYDQEDKNKDDDFEL